MSITQLLALAATVYCLGSILVHFVKLIRLGNPKDLSQKSGDTSKGIAYSNTVAMMPQNKESAFLHIPSYASGMLFHIGIFCSLLTFVLSFFPFFTRWITGSGCSHYIVAGVIAICCLCGYGLLIKRIFSKDLRPLSTPDDYISNALVSTFQLVTVLLLCCASCCCISNLYYIVCTLLFVYLPLGKLRHVVYYFAARYHLGFFYGWRNVWPKDEK